MGMESTQSRMTRMGHSELLLNKTLETDESISKIEAVNVEQINAVLKNVDFNLLSLSVVGNCLSEGKYQDFISAFV